jgi:zinc protease
MSTIIATAAVVTLGSCGHMNRSPAGSGERVQPSLAQDARLPVDTAVTVGKLGNGLTYYIRRNGKPEKRLELRLVVNAGSVLEDENQRGIAHFCEHMAFNGTKNFKKRELTDYLESIGMRFGPELNAYTGFDETVYMLQVPTDSAGVVEKSFQILEDWAHLVSYDDSEIDRERGVILEEWRLGRGADARMRDKQIPILLKDSRYAERLPIGKREVIEGAPHEVIRSFYHEWYRPELMAVIAVGDLDTAGIERLIRQHFSGFETPKDTPKRAMFPVPDHKETLFAIATDPEATRSGVSILYTRAVHREKTVRDYRRKIVEGLYNAALNRRLNELARKADPPYLFAYSALDNLVRTKDVYLLGAGVREGGIERGLDTLLTEAVRVERFGFTPSEIEREKEELLRSMEQAYNERAKTESASYAAEYADNFMSDEPIPGIEFEYRLFREEIPGITVDEVNRLAGELITDANRVIWVNAPEKPGMKAPSEKELLSVFDAVRKKEVAAYTDTVSDSPLVSGTPEGSPVTAERSFPELGVTEWTLANGVRVVLKPTDFKNDEVLLSAFSPGGSSLVPDSLVVPAETATSVIGEGGLDGFSLTDLEKKLAGKIVSVSPLIDDLEEGLSGSASPKDMETLFQLVWLTFTAPRPDSTAFRSVVERLRGMVENRSARPETAFGDTLAVTMAGYSPRVRPWTINLLREMSLSASSAIYRDRFADAGDFTFFFVGAFDTTAIKPLVETWLGGLPSLGRKESWRDLGIRPPAGVVEKTVRKGIEPKSQTRIVFSGPFEWTLRNRYVLDSLASALRIRLREVLREDMSGTYGVSVGISVDRFPRSEYLFSVGFGSAPERADELAATVFALIDTVKAAGVSEATLAKVKEAQLRQREVNLKENSFWLSALRTYYSHGDDPLDILKYPELVRSLTSNDIKKAAEMYLNEKNYVKVVLMPEKK